MQTDGGWTWGHAWACYHRSLSTLLCIFKIFFYGCNGLANLKSIAMKSGLALSLTQGQNSSHKTTTSHLRQTEGRPCVRLDHVRWSNLRVPLCVLPGLLDAPWSPKNNIAGSKQQQSPVVSKPDTVTARSAQAEERNVPIRRKMFEVPYLHLSTHSHCLSTLINHPTKITVAKCNTLEFAHPSY